MGNTREDVFESIAILQEEALTEGHDPHPDMYKRYLNDPNAIPKKKDGTPKKNTRIGYGSWVKNNGIPWEKAFVKTSPTQGDRIKKKKAQQKISAEKAAKRAEHMKHYDEYLKDPSIKLKGGGRIGYASWLQRRAEANKKK